MFCKETTKESLDSVGILILKHKEFEIAIETPSPLPDATRVPLENNTNH